MTTVKTAATNLIHRVKTNPFLTILWSLLVVLLAIFFAVMFSKNLCWISPYLGLTEKNEILTFLGIGMGGILLALQAVIANRRAKALENTVLNAERGQRQERFKNSIELLGHKSVSVRLGAAYELFHLAKDPADQAKNLRQTIMDILCAHIRQTTGEREYREKYKSKPSEEIQNLLTLLFVREHKIFEGLHVNLRGSWLNGADLQNAHLEKADLTKISLQGTELQDARLQEAQISYAQLDRAMLFRTWLQKAHLWEASLQETWLMEAYLQGAQLSRARLQRALLWAAHLQGALLQKAHMHGARLRGACLQGAELFEAQLQGAELESACLQGATSQQAYGSTFKRRIRANVGRESDLGRVDFQGGLSQENIDSFVEGLSDEKASQLRDLLEPQIDEPISHDLPENSGAITGTYTEKEAEQWIAEYEEAILEIPKTANGP